MARSRNSRWVDQRLAMAIQREGTMYRYVQSSLNATADFSTYICVYLCRDLDFIRLGYIRQTVGALSTGLHAVHLKP